MFCFSSDHIFDTHDMDNLVHTERMTLCFHDNDILVVFSATLDNFLAMKRMSVIIGNFSFW